MQCEVCGRKILGKPVNATIEGAKMIVCGKCAKLGTVYFEEPPSPALRKRRVTTRPRTKFSLKKQPPKVTETLELVENFSLQIRQAREHLGLNHEDLGRKIGEKVSVLRKIETGKMTPNHQLAGKLEHTLRVKLLVPHSEPKIPPSVLPKLPELTLGKIVHLKKSKRDSTEE